MNVLRLHELNPKSNPVVLSLTGSKSETNRLLILQALWPELELSNLALCDDSTVMMQALKHHKGTIDVGHAGTAMRFLTAYYACMPGSEVVLTGSSRMKQRPIGLLVEALRTLGAKVDYLEQEGYPPLSISGIHCIGGRIEISGKISSQYLTALMLVATKFDNGLTIEVLDELTSLPYLKMTAALLSRLGVEVILNDNQIVIRGPLARGSHKINIESDWSGASYWYSLVALRPQCSLILKDFHRESRQGDAALVDRYKALGVDTEFIGEGQIRLSASGKPLPEFIEWNLADTPDLAQTIAVTCFGLGMACHLTGLHTLKIKETDRLLAMARELTKMGAEVETSSNSLILKARKNLHENVVIETYHDHRMAMAFAPLVALVSIGIADPDVVSKSYPEFWRHLDQVGVQMN